MLMPSVAGYGDVLFLPRCRSDTAVEFGGELYTFVDVDRTLQGVSGGDQRRRSLQARGLERGFLFVGHETISSRRHNANEFWSAAGSLSGIRVAQPFTGGKAALPPARCGVRIRHQKARSQAVDGADLLSGSYASLGGMTGNRT